jgi:hypothetical protein
MKGYKETDAAGREQASRERKKAAVQKFQAHTRDSQLEQRLTEREAGNAARSTLRAEGKAARAQKEAHEAEVAHRSAVAAAEKAQDDLEQQRLGKVADEADRKAARDARYAARKARTRR